MRNSKMQKIHGISVICKKKKMKCLKKIVLVITLITCYNINYNIYIFTITNKSS